MDALRKDAEGNTNHLLFLPDNGPDRGTRLPNLADEQFKADAQIQHSFRTEPFLNEKGLPSPVAGDTRCAENVKLTSFHTVFARMHNVIAEGLKKVMDTDDMDHVFFEARQINIALLNHIIPGWVELLLTSVVCFESFFLLVVLDSVSTPIS